MATFALGDKKKTQLKLRAGLDIGTSDIKLLEVAEGPGKFVVTAFGVKTPVTHSREETIHTIKTLVETAKVVSKTVNIAVSGPAVIVRFITMPKMTREEMAGAIRFEAEKHIPFNINECVIDFQVLRRYDKENKCDVLLAAAKREYVEERVKTVLDANLSVGIVDIDGFAFANAFLKNYPSASNAASGNSVEKTTLLLDIGSALTNLVILKGQSLCLLRDVAIGGRDLGAAIARSCGLDPKDADAVRKAAAENAAMAAAAMRPVLTNLLDEIRLSCSYYENQCGRAIDDIYVSGGASSVDGLLDIFQESFGVKPNPLDVFQAFDTMNVDADALAKVRGSLAVAVGLACR